jgi:DUF4097 and DUF4098 domain-containing protein YvlB
VIRYGRVAAVRFLMEHHRSRTAGIMSTGAFLAVCCLLSAKTVPAQEPRRIVEPGRPVPGSVDRSVRRIGSSTRRSARAVRDRPPRFERGTDRQYGAEFRKRFERNFRVSPRAEISVLNEFGSVSVRPWNGNQVRVRADIIARAPKAARARQLAHDTMVDVHAGAKQIVVTTQYPDTRDSAGVLIQTDYEVSVPARSNLYIENRFGDVDIYGVDGTVESVCSHGQTRVERMSGNLKLVSENGNVIGRSLASETRIDAQFGRVDLRDVSGWTTVHSRYGSVRIGASSSDCDVHVTCNSGDIEVILPPDADPRMDVNTTFGAIRSEIPVRVQTVGNSSTARRASNSVQRIDLTNSMGDVTVRLAGSTAPDRVPLVGPDKVPVPPIKHEVFQLAPGGLVKIEEGRGDIKIAEWDRNVLGVAATGAGEHSIQPAETPEKNLKGPQVKVGSAPDGTRVAWISPAPVREGVRAGLDIKVPPNTALEIANTRGDIVIDSVYGKLNVSNSHGNIKVMNLKPVKHDCSLRCTDGSISMLIPKGSNVAISAETEDGSIDSAIPMQGYVMREKSSLTGSTEKPGTVPDALVELKVTRGRIVIN